MSSVAGDGGITLQETYARSLDNLKAGGVENVALVRRQPPTLGGRTP